MTQSCFHCVVSGKVQGVWFRASTQDQATRLGLGGWVSNLPNGSVEIFACGEMMHVEALKEWLKQGPPLAEVTQIEYYDVGEGETYQEFTIR